MAPTHTRRETMRRIGAGVLILGGTTGIASAEGGDSAGLRVAHASPDAPPVDVYVDGELAVGGLAFESVTDYLELPDGEVEVEVTVADSDTTVFGPVSVQLAAEDYTAVALGEVGSDDTEFTVSLFEDTNGATIGSDEARIRAIHASPDAPPVDVTVDDGGLTVVDGVACGESSGYAVVPTGDYEVEIRPDTENDDGPVVLETHVDLTGRSTYTVFALGYLTPTDEGEDAPEFGLLPTLDAGAPPRGDGEDPGGPGRGGR